MSGLKSILAIVDPTRPAPQIAMAKATALALVSGASVELVLCDAAPREGQSLLAELATPLKAAGIAVTTLAIAGSPHHELLSYVSASTADLVVKATHGHSLTRRVFSHTTDRRLMEVCPVPLLLAKPRPWSATPIIMAAINPAGVCDPASRLDSAILDLAESFAGWLNGDLHIVHAYTPSVAPQRGTGFFGVPAVDAVDDACAERECRLDVLDRFIAAQGTRHRQLHVDMGSTASYIKRMALELPADMLVIGTAQPAGEVTQSRRKLAHRIFDTLACDVLLVRYRGSKQTTGDLT